ncbi:chromosome partitioning protein ParA [Oryzomicrobium terrae]|uniref:Chromosome partitioning protein ParA n=1 Tax=Oryzomicrobium terrae TaxID=1735038 RepID=A0A5C1E6W2_9RHOO|nr:ParA family protein [Oryzomicrobium terrae]QEL64672.1 chromosome partitioning protein ParA [Oryzomicrobium terrae]
MTAVLIANPKGGAGKSTLATNLAGYLARQGHAVMLGDLDVQQSAREWLALRPDFLAPIRSWEVAPNAPARPPRGTTHAVLDSPAGFHGKPLDKALKAASHVLVPVQPSLFDILATRRFLEVLQAEKTVRKGQIKVGVVGMRVDARTRAAGELERFFDAYELPVLSYLRDTQLYVQVAAQGATLFDLAPHKVERDLEQWQPITAWVDS